jgi:hypothetical protein
LLLPCCTVSGKLWQTAGRTEKARQVFETSYSRLVAAFVTAYGVRDRDLGAFRARLTFWQKGGVLGVSPGKGKALRYTPDLIHRLIFSIELAECGASPAAVVGTVADLWEKRIQRGFELAEAAAMNPPSPDDIAFELGNVSLMIGAWASTAKALPNINWCKLAKLPDHLALWMNDSNPSRAPRVVVVNLSERLRRVHVALAAAAESDQPQAAQTKAKKRGRRRKGA